MHTCFSKILIFVSFRLFGTNLILKFRKWFLVWWMLSGILSSSASLVFGIQKMKLLHFPREIAFGLGKQRRKKLLKQIIWNVLFLNRASFNSYTHALEVLCAVREWAMAVSVMPLQRREQQVHKNTQILAEQDGSLAAGRCPSSFWQSHWFIIIIFSYRLVIEGKPILISPQFYVIKMVLHVYWSPDILALYCLTTVEELTTKASNISFVSICIFWPNV